MAPEALPSGYRRWITNASKVPPAVLPTNLSAQRHGTFDPDVARQVLTNKNGYTSKGKALVEAYAQRAEKVSTRANALWSE